MFKKKPQVGRLKTVLVSQKSIALIGIHFRSKTSRPCDPPTAESLPTPSSQTSRLMFPRPQSRAQLKPRRMEQHNPSLP